MRAAIWMVATKQFPLLDRLLAKLIPKAVMEKMLEHHKLSVEKMDRRLATKTERPDFVTYLVERARGIDKINLEEMHSNSTLIILGGSETSATALSGGIYHLSQNSDKLDKLVHEIRTELKTEDNFTLNNLAHLPYLNACLEDSMRIYPPVAGYLPRTAPKEGCSVAGHWVPPGVSTSLSSLHKPKLIYATTDSSIHNSLGHNTLEKQLQRSR
jgi:cytochrome P450